MTVQHPSLPFRLSRVLMGWVLLLGCSSQDRDGEIQPRQHRMPEPVELAGRAASGAAPEVKDGNLPPVPPSPMRPPRVVQPASGQAPFAGQNVAVLVPRGATINLPVEEVKEEFEAATGATLEIVSVPFEEMYIKYVNDSVSNQPRYDAMLAGAWWLGDLVSKNIIQSYDRFYGDPRFPTWDVSDVHGAQARLLSYGGNKYLMPYDHDGQVLYYRRDLFASPEHKAAFRTHYGYELAAPRTWAEFRDMAEYFHGKDLSGDGKADYGLTLHLKQGAHGMFHFMSFSAPFLIGPNNPMLYWFDPETLEPLIDSPGHLRALQELVKLVNFGPAEMIEWEPTQAWEVFLRGEAALTFSWGDLGALAQQEDSKVKGKTASAPIPGTMEYYDIRRRRWIAVDTPNRVGNTTGGSWSGVISAQSNTPEATYYLFSLLAHRDKARFYAARGSDGVDPGRYSQYLPPHGTADIKMYQTLGWDESDIRDYSAAFFANFDNPLQFPYLRTPGAYSYWLSLDTQLHLALSGRMEPEEALRAAKLDFEEITKQLGRGTIAQVYRTSLGLEKGKGKRTPRRPAK